MINVSLSIQLDFYYNEYDWGVIYREIGTEDRGNNKFYKVTEKWLIYFILESHYTFPDQI